MVEVMTRASCHIHMTLLKSLKDIQRRGANDGQRKHLQTTMILKTAFVSRGLSNPGSHMNTRMADLDVLIIRKSARIFFLIDRHCRLQGDKFTDI